MWVLFLDKELQAADDCWEGEDQPLPWMSPLIEYPIWSGHP